ncbi:MAG: UDP-2,3-diacylglucosamine diphosphatase LpxI [bacterium]
MIAIIEGGGGISKLLKEKIKKSILVKLPLKSDIDEIICLLKNKGIKRVIFAGKFEKAMLYKTKEFFPKKDDDSIIKYISSRFEKEGIRVLNQRRYLSSYLAKKGPLTPCKPSKDEMEDIEKGLIVAKKINSLGIGQSVCIKDGIIISVEGLEGTNETIKRAGKITDGFVVVKYGKKGREIPVIGEETIMVMKKANATALAIKNNIVIILPKTLELAEKSRISVVGV